ncbi:MAG: 4Fe-4S binding protein [Spirochaetaceae bacterium]|nr:MAG: 4Fe-4S binding protein [Spirochaetaceae bacterium]
MNRPGWVKAGVFVFIFLLVAAGRWIASSAAALRWPAVLFSACCYGLLAAGIAAFISDLILVRSLLQRKILFIKILGAVLITVGVIDGMVALSGLTALISLLFAAALVVILMVTDAAGSAGSELRVSMSERLPNRYLRRRPLKSVLETLLRLFPFPEPVGLYRIGSAGGLHPGGVYPGGVYPGGVYPGVHPPVLVTGNFELTLRRVCSALRNLDCWLLVCESRGVNVWCASMAGYFTTDSVVRAIQTTNLAERVSGRTLILPQLCASSISLEELKTRTGFSAHFGPLYIRDMQRFLKNPSDPAIRQADFPLGARLEMALGSPLLLSIVVTLVYNFIGLGHLLVVLPLLYLASLIQGFIFPVRPLRRIGPWALLYGAALFLLTGLLSRALFPDHLLLYAVTVGVGASYLVNEFSGWSPLLKYSLIPRTKPEVWVDTTVCIGCRRCVDVCPRGVFRMEAERSVVVAEHRCVLCRSCFSQCPSGAVRHSHDPKEPTRSFPGSAPPAP